MDPLKTDILPRDVIAQFIKSPAGVRNYEAIQGDTVNVYQAVTAAQFLTLTPDPNLGSERILQLAAGEITGSDGGAGGNYTLGLADTAIVAGAYGSATQTVSYTVDTKGRLIAGNSFSLITTNILEGTKLFYTDARARAALSGGAGIAYNSGTGSIALAASGVVAGTYPSPTSITVDAFGRITAIT